MSEQDWRSRPANSIMLTFKDKGVSGIAERHEGELANRLGQLCQNPPICEEVNSAEMKKAWKRLKLIVTGVYESHGRPLRVVVDLNSVPRYLALSLIGFGAKTGIFERFVVFYAAATEYKSVGESLFTDGAWLPRAVPTLGEGAAPSSRSHLVVMAGFEGDHTRRLVNALEPDRVSIAISTGIRAEHERIARQANSELAQEYLLEDGGVIWLPAQDVASSVETLHAGIRTPVSDGIEPAVAVSFLLCGTKLAALSAALYSLDAPVAQIYYSDPERRVESSAVHVEWATLVELNL